MRTADAALELLDAGVERVVVGTAAVERPALVEELCHEYPGRVAVGLDARGNEVADPGLGRGLGRRPGRRWPNGSTASGWPRSS